MAYTVGYHQIKDQRAGALTLANESNLALARGYKVVHYQFFGEALTILFFKETPKEPSSLVGE